VIVRLSRPALELNHLSYIDNSCRYVLFGPWSCPISESITQLEGYPAYVLSERYLLAHRPGKLQAGWSSGCDSLVILVLLVLLVSSRCGCHQLCVVGSCFTAHSDAGVRQSLRSWWGCTSPVTCRSTCVHQSASPRIVFVSEHHPECRADYLCAERAIACQQEDLSITG
jgi:hypothetical protein